MIKATNLVKCFGQTTALSCLNTQIRAGSIYGLVGSNGAGKSTLLRLLAGVYRPDGGQLTIDDRPVYDDPAVGEQVVFVPDDLYFMPGATIRSMAAFYRGLYPTWDEERFEKLCSYFPLQADKRIATFSKGMKRQAALILALACRPRYLLLDEAFDGLDPVIRVLLRKLLADEVAERGMTVLIASHNLRELEDLCDEVGVLHRGTILFQRELDDLKLGFCKVQAAFRPMPAREALTGIEVLKYEVRGSLLDLVARGSREEVLAYLEGFSPLFSEAVPLTLEEVFIQEMEAVGYDYNNVIF